MIKEKASIIGWIFVLVAIMLLSGSYLLSSLSFVPYNTQEVRDILGQSMTICTANAKFGQIYRGSTKTSSTSFDPGNGIFVIEARENAAAIRGEFNNIKVDPFINRVNLFSSVNLNQGGNQRSSLVFSLKDNSGKTVQVGAIEARNQVKELSSGNIHISFKNKQVIFEGDNVATQFTDYSSLGDDIRLYFDLDAQASGSSSKSNSGNFNIEAIEVINTLSSSITPGIESPTAAEETAEETVQPIVVKELIAENSVSLGIIALIIGLSILTGLFGSMLIFMRK